MYCLDTDISIALMRGYADAKSKVAQLQALDAELSVTYMTLCELYKGACLSVNKERNVALVNEFLERVTMLPQSKLSCLLFGQDYAYLQKKGMLTQQIDLMIAGICKANNRVLVTRNTKDFRNIPNLLVERW